MGNKGRRDVEHREEKCVTTRYLKFVSPVDFDAFVHDGVEISLPNIGGNLQETTQLKGTTLQEL